ncbi:hypothetical protein PUN28_010950 [Cardiocondyla obscurior]|uniref:Uncharacterized protein n=1 Tax=Cardiocondyla obscurior TaxID=286306 RepID=A0AAW2FN07_9HYME
MKSYALVCVALTTIFFIVYAKEECKKENCITPDKCEQLVQGNISCEEQGTSCCSVVKNEFRTHCNHYGGECMDSCSQILSHNTIDCINDQICCILV